MILIKIFFFGFWNKVILSSLKIIKKSVLGKKMIFLLQSLKYYNTSTNLVLSKTYYFRARRINFAVEI